MIIILTLQITIGRGCKLFTHTPFVNIPQVYVPIIDNIYDLKNIIIQFVCLNIVSIF